MEHKQEIATQKLYKGEKSEGKKVSALYSKNTPEYFRKKREEEAQAKKEAKIAEAKREEAKREEAKREEAKREEAKIAEAEAQTKTEAKEKAEAKRAKLEKEKIEQEIEQKIDEIKIIEYNNNEIDSKIDEINKLINELPSDSSNRKTLEIEIKNLKNTNDKLLKYEKSIDNKKFEELQKLIEEINKIEYFNKDNLIEKVQKIITENSDYNEKLTEYESEYRNILNVKDSSNLYQYNTLIERLKTLQSDISTNLNKENTLPDLIEKKNKLLSNIENNLLTINYDYAKAKTIFKDSLTTYATDKFIVFNKEPKNKYNNKYNNKYIYSELLELKKSIDFFLTKLNEEFSSFKTSGFEGLNDEDMEEIIETYIQELKNQYIGPIDNEIKKRDDSLQKMINEKNDIYNRTLNGSFCNDGKNNEKCISDLRTILNSNDIYNIKYEDPQKHIVEEAKKEMIEKINTKIQELERISEAKSKEAAESEESERIAKAKEVERIAEAAEAERIRQKEEEEEKARIAAKKTNYTFTIESKTQNHDLLKQIFGEQFTIGQNIDSTFIQKMKSRLKLQGMSVKTLLTQYGIDSIRQTTEEITEQTEESNTIEISLDTYPQFRSLPIQNTTPIFQTILQ